MNHAVAFVATIAAFLVGCALSFAIPALLHKSPVPITNDAFECHDESAFGRCEMASQLFGREVPGYGYCTFVQSSAGLALVGCR